MPAPHPPPPALALGVVPPPPDAAAVPWMVQSVGFSLASLLTSDAFSDHAAALVGVTWMVKVVEPLNAATGETGLDVTLAVQLTRPESVGGEMVRLALPVLATV